MNGKGVLIWGDGREYEGEFVKDKRKETNLTQEQFAGRAGGFKCIFFVHY